MPKNDIPVKIIKALSYIFSYFTHHNFNKSLLSSILPSKLKKADIANLISEIIILLVLPKTYEKCMFKIKCIISLIKFL